MDYAEYVIKQFLATPSMRAATLVVAEAPGKDTMYLDFGAM